MRCVFLLTWLLLLPVLVSADAGMTFDANSPLLGLGGGVGLELNRLSTDPYPVCLVYILDGAPCWGMGMDVTRDYPGTPDLVLAYSHDLNADNLRIRADDARMVLGYRMGHPQMPYQFQVQAGMPGESLGGVAIGAPNWMPQLYLYNENAPNANRTTINFGDLYALQTDSGFNNSGDFYLWSWAVNHPVFTVTPDDAFRLDTAKAGFFGAAPVTRPAVTGSWSDFTAARSLLAALVQLGLVTDQTTP